MDRRARRLVVALAARLSNLVISTLIAAAGMALTLRGALTFMWRRANRLRLSRADGVVTELIPVRSAVSM